MYNSFKSVSNIENFGFLNHLNTEELRSVFDDEQRLEELVKDVKQCKDIEKEKEMLLVSNRSLAEYNLNKEPLLLVLKKQVLELSEICDNLYKSIEEKFNNTAPRGGTSNLETKLSCLQMATQEMEEESEATAESFLDGSIELDDFLEKFMQKRKLMHLRKVKTDKMKEILNEMNSYRAPYPPANFYLSQISNLNGAMRPMY
ncbi:hypothetical protein O3M35_004471 [Rhynocoris fuscipes]|uniref:VPS37 C-terminal domain-containing protein n=1 Tax=Rhynocoris fuscipes TaxID=488301 RepID=A0AAW1CLI8_9HEMI